MKVTALLLLTLVAGTAAFKLTIKTYDGTGGCDGTADSSVTVGVGCQEVGSSGSTVGKLSGDSCTSYEYTTCDTCNANTGVQTCSSSLGPHQQVLLRMCLPPARPCPWLQHRSPHPALTVHSRTVLPLLC